ncbi:tRNA 2-thiouridine(34) synthase MnmA [Candidatus Berkelbacteria bacterium]|nr:tRNA 2-thiouridine(34) synthase MnmA [Candidatus Berkelbacteria bacterium]
MSKRTRYLVGLSGGVDSSVAAARLLEAGHEVVGVYLKAWEGWEDRGQRTEDNPNRLSFTGQCPWKDDIADGRRVAAHLGIPYEVIEVHEAYRARVVDVMLAEYAAGRTPNPDILCNREMKFGLLLDLARELGFDGVATGHYAQVRPSFTSQESAQSANTPEVVPARPSKVKGHMSKVELHRGRDERKDQSYFLWNIDRRALSMIEFPLGDSTKVQVREEARRRSLPTAEKKDSQGICFLGPVDLRQFLIDQLQLVPGEVVDTAGRSIGTHRGAAAYTVGQREGLRVEGVGSRGEIRPRYVVARELESNRLIVDTQPPTSRELVATHLNWLVDDLPKVGERIEARIRHGQQPQRCTVEETTRQPDRQTTKSGGLAPGMSGSLHLRFREPQVAIAPGQSVVFSRGSLILGGGIIAEPVAGG